MPPSIVVRVVLEKEATFVTHESLGTCFIEDLHHGPLRFTSSAEVFLPFVGRYGRALSSFVDEVDSPFDRINRRTVVDIIVSSVQRPLLAFFDLGANVTVFDHAISKRKEYSKEKNPLTLQETGPPSVYHTAYEAP